MITATAGSAGHAPHVPPPDDDAREITWYPATQLAERERDMRWSCECKTVVYYLVSGGGQYWIRRQMALAKGRTSVSLTEVLTERDARRLWDDILLGRAQ